MAGTHSFHIHELVQTVEWKFSTNNLNIKRYETVIGSIFVLVLG